MRDGEHVVGHLEQLDPVTYRHWPEDCAEGFRVDDVEEVLVPVIGLYELCQYFIFFVCSLEDFTCATGDSSPTYDEFRDCTLKCMDILLGPPPVIKVYSVGEFIRRNIWKFVNVPGVPV